MGILSACMSMHHVCACVVPAEVRRKVDPLELELQTVVNCHMGDGTRTRESREKAVSVLNP